MKVKLSQTTRALANGAASGDERPILTGIKITKTEAVVADGFLLVIKTLQPAEMEFEKPVDDGIGEVVVPADAIKACKGEAVILQTIEAMKPVPKAELLGGNATVAASVIIARMEGDEFNVEADSIQGKYPDHDQLIGGVSPFIGQIAFNTTLLKKLLKTLPSDSIVQFRISEQNKPVELQCQDPDGDIPIRGVIMPMDVLAANTIWRTKPETKPVERPD